MDVITIDHVVTTGGNCTAQGPCWYLNICPTQKASGAHAVCYEVQMDDGIIGVDLYNQTLTGKVSKVLNSAATDSDHIPVVAIGCDIWNLQTTGDKSATVTAATGSSSTSSGPSVLVLNDQGVVAPTITGDHNGHANDYMAVVVLAIGATDAHASITDGNKAPTMLARAGTGGGNEPIVLMRIEHESISNENRSIVCEQPSGELHRTGCVQRHASGVQEE